MDWRVEDRPRRRRRARCASSTIGDGASRGTASAIGEIQVRGPWITGAYYRDPAPEKFDNGWLRTGDVGTIDPRLHPDHRPRQGRDQVRRRVDLLGRTGEPSDGAPGRARGGGHRRTQTPAGTNGRSRSWSAREGRDVRRGTRRVPRRSRRPLAMPERWTFVDEIPKTSVGKFDKKVLRAMYADGKLLAVELGAAQRR